MKPTVSLMMVPFREVRHSKPDDFLHYEPIHVRGKLHHWVIPAHRHEDLHQFQFISRGAIEATLDGERKVLHAPAAIMIAPGVVHGFVYEQDSIGQQVTVPTATLKAFLGSSVTLQEKLQNSILIARDDVSDWAEECKGLFDFLAQEFLASHPGRTEALEARVMLLTLWFLRRQAAPRAELRSQAMRDTLVQRYRQLLETHFREHRLLHFYADTLSVTADHLSRTCRSITGTSALQLIHDRVVLEARRLLAYTPASVMNIAQELGFDDPAYFSRFFAKTTGEAPTNYRRLVTQGLALMPTSC
jgi:AraC family transcriptional activator of pobA